MSLLNAVGALLKPQTPLQQLLEDINFQRNKEMRQLLNDDSGFVVLQGTTYWTDLFVRHFLFQSEPVKNIDSDDLLFFVRKKHIKNTSRHMPKYETEINVFRKDSRKLPIGDPDVDWEETVYLNMVIHQFDYTLTLAICTRTSPKELQVLRRHSQRVYASPSRRKMDTKGDGEEITYPHICFMVDNFDEVFSDILVRDGEMVCVELVANDKDGAVQGVIFLGSIRYDALKKVYDSRQSSLSSKVAQRMSLGLFSSGANVQTRCEFVRMKGPQGKGHAEMAVTKPKGSGMETPTSEPGFCATDMWDEWADENDECYRYNQQRRLSDPSSTLNNMSYYGWRHKDTQQDYGNYFTGAKARSENEGLDNLNNEISIIEAGDLRDDLRSAFLASKTHHINKKFLITNNASNNVHTLIEQEQENVQEQDINEKDIEIIDKNYNEDKVQNDSKKDQTNFKYETNNLVNNSSNQKTDIEKNSLNCLKKRSKSKKKVWNLQTDSNSPKRTTEKSRNIINDVPNCSNKLNKTKSHLKNTSILDEESELVVQKRGKLKLPGRKLLVNKKIVRSSSLNQEEQRKVMLNENSKNMDKKKQSKIEKGGKKSDNKEVITKERKRLSCNVLSKLSPKRLNGKMCTNEAISLEIIKVEEGKCCPGKATSNTKNVCNRNTIIGNIDNQQEFEIADDVVSLSGLKLNEKDLNKSTKKAIVGLMADDRITVCGKEELPIVETQITDNEGLERKSFNDNFVIPQTEIVNGNSKTSIKVDNNEESNNCLSSVEIKVGDQKLQSTSERSKQHKLAISKIIVNLVPRRKTSDGTSIYYWCNMPKKVLKELDDGIYNPLWASRGFAQSFHFWKESKRQQSTPLNAFLTYVTLPWWSIAKDLLDHRETPILTF